jgi:hypothetical protein
VGSDEVIIDVDTEEDLKNMIKKLKIQNILDNNKWRRWP